MSGCQNYSNLEGVNATMGGLLPPGTCWDTPDAFFALIVANLKVQFPGKFAGIMIGDQVPAAEDRDKLWFRVTSACEPLGLFIYYNGAWKRAIPNPLPAGSIIHYYDPTFTASDHAENKVKITYLDNYSETYSAGVAAVDPFWRVCDGTNGTPDLRGRSIMGAGIGSGLADRQQGQSIGEEAHTLAKNELPNLNIPYSTTPGTGLLYPAGGTETGNYGLISGGGTPLNIIHPCFVAYPIIRTSRKI